MTQVELLAKVEVLERYQRKMHAQKGSGKPKKKSPNALRGPMLAKPYKKQLAASGKKFCQVHRLNTSHTTDKCWKVQEAVEAKGLSWNASTHSTNGTTGPCLGMKKTRFDQKTQEIKAAYEKVREARGW